MRPTIFQGRQRLSAILPRIAGEAPATAPVVVLSGAGAFEETRHADA
jgi:hypothetical protein